MTDLYFLGGRDLEMAEIAALLARHAPGRVVDDGLAWGARASHYLDRIEAALGEKRTPVLVELYDDLPACIGRTGIVIIDHHGELAGADKPTSLEQVFARLGLSPQAWTRRMALVAANDRGHIPEMAAIGAGTAEMAEIRRQDRAAQGVGAQDEREALAAIAAREIFGPLTLLRVPGPSSSAAADMIQPELGGPGCEDLLVATGKGLAFYGRGGVVLRLARSIPGGWSGGALPARGFWGIDIAPGPERETLVRQMALWCDERRETP